MQTDTHLCCNGDSSIKGGIAIDNVIFWKGDRFLVKCQIKQCNLSSLYTAVAFLEKWVMIKTVYEYFVLCYI